MAAESIDLAMLIDDSDIDLFVQKRFIEISGFARSILVFQSARKALEFISTPEQKCPDVIFLDLNMPDMDGFKFLEQLDNLPAHARNKSKVVILTSSSSVADITRASAFKNVITFVSKPLSEKRLVDLQQMISGT
jgi:CheY-like chemotaxis protein